MSKPVTESVLASIIGVSADAVICTDAAHRITFFNEGAAKIFGYSAHEMLGKPLDLLLPMPAQGAHTEHMQRFARSPVPARPMGERQEIRGRRKNGEEFPAEAAIAHSASPDGSVFSVVLRDVSARHRAEMRQRLLTESAQRFGDSIELDETLDLTVRLWVPRFAVAALADASVGPSASRTLCVVPRDDNTREAVFHDVFGAPAHLTEEAWRAGARVDGFSAAAVADVDEAAATVIQRLEPRVVVTLPLVARARLLGLLRLFRHEPLDREDLELAAAIAARAAMAIDNARLLDEVRRAVRSRDETIGVVSHDLRNPVNAMRMLAGAILRDDSGESMSGTATERVKLMFKAAEQMDMLIQDLLDASRVESGRLRINALSVPAGTLLAGAVATLEPLAADRGIRLQTELSGRLPDVLADPDRITQVLSNIVGNALKFSPAGGTVSVRASVAGTAVQVIVIDEGPGIPHEHRQRVFERYWQVNRSNGGVGLGLTIARGIVEAHGGRIWVDDDRTSGAAVLFTLPVSGG